MRYFFSIISLFIFSVCLTAAEKSPELTAAQFYNEKAAALSITQPALRMMKLLALLEKYPSRAGELHSLINAALEQNKMTPQIKALSLEILKKNPGNILINLLLNRAYGKLDTRIEKFQETLLCCKTENLSEQEEQALLIMATILLEYHSSLRQCDQRKEFFLKFFDRVKNVKADPRFRTLLLSCALDFYRQCIWETGCIVPGGKVWEKLPATGIKKHYLDAVAELETLEKVLEFPISLELFKLYNRHNLPRAAVYGRRFLTSRSPLVTDALFTTAQNNRDRELFDYCINYFAMQKKKSANDILMPLIAVRYASEFKSYDMLQKFASPAEVEIFKSLHAKKYADALPRAKELLSSGKITLPSTIRAMVELVWETKDKALCKEMISTLEKNPALLTAENANAVAYTAAVLNIELDKAEKLARTALKQLPSSFAVMDTLAYTLYRKQQFAEAHKLITDAEKLLSPGDACAVLYLHAAEIELAHTKDKTAAKKWLDRGFLAARDNDEEFDYTRAAQLQEMLKK